MDIINYHKRYLIIYRNNDNVKKWKIKSQKEKQFKIKKGLFYQKLYSTQKI